MSTHNYNREHTTNNQGQYPFPKEVWSPSGGWWSRPANWRSNTIVALAGIGLATFGVWRISARNEVCHLSSRKREGADEDRLDISLLLMLFLLNV
jgi:hypothetical protein